MDEWIFSIIFAPCNSELNAKSIEMLLNGQYRRYQFTPIGVDFGVSVLWVSSIIPEGLTANDPRLFLGNNMIKTIYDYANQITQTDDLES